MIKQQEINKETISNILECITKTKTKEELEIIETLLNKFWDNVKCNIPKSNLRELFEAVALKNAELEIKKESKEEEEEEVGNLYNEILKGDYEVLTTIDKVKKGMSRNNFFTSSYSLTIETIDIYTEGLYVALRGTQTKVNIFINKRGEVVRKKKKLNYIETLEIKVEIELI